MTWLEERQAANDGEVAKIVATVERRVMRGNASWSGSWRKPSSRLRN